MTNSSLGLYLHIPFCDRKCNYCDFYSAFPTEETLNSYTVRLINAVKEWGGEIHRPIDSIYLGGGTPSVLGSRVEPLLQAVYNNFEVAKNAEITMEVNPASNLGEVLLCAKRSGVNRLSIGAQSGDDFELKVLGRRHTANDTEKTVKEARKLGFQNISLDLMLGLPDSNLDTIKKSLDFILGLEPEHISSYILKIEERTAFYKNRNLYNFPDDDSQAEQYLYLCDYLESNGYNHYEISNFCLKGKESKHNLKYWQGKEYLGLGPSAHSFYNGKRFYFPRDLKAFMSQNEPVFDGLGGGSEEYVMLSLRLKAGLNFYDLEKRFGCKLNGKFLALCRVFEKNKLAVLREENFRLTNSGMLISNSIITEILGCLE